LRTLLGGGLLTPLDKVEPVPTRSPDARPVNAEDLDTSHCCKPLARDLTPAVKEAVIPQQLGAGVRGGVELVAVALKIEYTNSVEMNVVGVFAQEDVEDVHNECDRDKAQEDHRGRSQGHQAYQAGHGTGADFEGTKSNLYALFPKCVRLRPYLQ